MQPLLTAAQPVAAARLARGALRLSEQLRLDEHLGLHVGDAPPVAARFDRAQVSPTRISLVQ